MTRRRGLSDEERRLWAEVARSTRPLKGARVPMAPETVMTDPSASGPSGEGPAMPAIGSETGPKAATRLEKVANAPQRPAYSQHPIERPTRRKLARGRTGIDSRLDLHELTQDRAHDALLGFLRRAQASGHRHVLVITGHGGTMPASGRERGILRRMVPLWFASPAFRPLVSGFESAERNHGGAGALYVRVRRRR